MIMSAANKLKARTWCLVKLAAFVCFAVAGGILIASLNNTNTLNSTQNAITLLASSSQPAFPPRGRLSKITVLGLA